MIGTKSNNIAAVVTLSVFVMVVAATQAEAGVVGQTKYTCDDGTCAYYWATNFEPDQIFDELVIDWSTEAMSGSITSAQLTELTFTLTQAGEVVYQDQAIINSLPQPIEGYEPRRGSRRDLSDIRILIDLDTPFMSHYSNGGEDNFRLKSSYFGLARNLFWSSTGGAPHIHAIDTYAGEFARGQTQWRPSSVTTVTTIVPEPATAFLFGLGMLLASGSLRRRRA